LTASTICCGLPACYYRKKTLEKLGRGVRVVSQKDKSEDGKEQTLLTVEGTVGAREAPFRTYRRVYAPLKHFGSTLVYFLQQRGDRPKRVPEERREVGERLAPLVELEQRSGALCGVGQL
jgi:hypothetical protein